VQSRHSLVIKAVSCPSLSLATIIAVHWSHINIIHIIITKKGNQEQTMLKIHWQDTYLTNSKNLPMGDARPNVIEYLLRVPWVWGFPWGFQWGFLLVWDGYGDWNVIPTAALRVMRPHKAADFSGPPFSLKIDSDELQHFLAINYYNCKSTAQCSAVKRRTSLSLVLCDMATSSPAAVSK